MSVFSSVDDASSPDHVLSYLDRTARAEAGMKHYAMAAHALGRPDGPILDVGCGAGHDLELLTSAGLRPIGVDPSQLMLAAAARRAGAATPLVRADGEHLPFGAASFSGCRMERVLMHVMDPAAVLAEVVRCLRPGSLVTVFEPDWSSFRVRDHGGLQSAGWIGNMRHPGMGAMLWPLLEQAGCEVLDRVEELSVWRSLRTLHEVIGLPASIEGAVQAGRVAWSDANGWLAEQESREADGTFYAEASKVMVLARTR